MKNFSVLYLILILINSVTVNAQDSWVQKASVGGPVRNWPVGFSIQSKGYIGFGDDGYNIKVDFWEYDTTTTAWTQKANFPGAGRLETVGFSIGNKGYIGTGADYNNLYKDFWEYDPLANTWTQKADL